MTRRRSAFILVEALVVVACLVALMAVLAADRRVAIQETQDRLRQRRAEMAVRSAVALAMATLEQASTNKVTLEDDWETLGDIGAARYDLGTATFRLQVVDACSLVNVNQAADAQFQLMPMDEQMRECLEDWRESGTTPRTDGAKDEYYRSLDTPYNARLGSLQTLDELLLVRGWTAERLYDTTDETIRSSETLEDTNGKPLPLASVLTADSGCPNTRADGSSRTNVSQGRLNPMTFIQMGFPPPVADRLAAGGPYTSFARLLATPGISTDQAQQLLNAVTFTNSTRLQGKINLNTARRAVLLTVPGVTTDIADAIVTRQSSGFAGLGDLATIPGLSGDTLAQVADYFTVGSDTFVVRAYGQSGGIGVAVEMTVRRDSDRVRILTWNRLAGSAVPAWWRWDDASVYAATVGAQ